VQYKKGTQALEVIYQGKPKEKKEAPKLILAYDKEKVEQLIMKITAMTKDEKGLKQITVNQKRMEGEAVKYDLIAQQNVTGEEQTIDVAIPANGTYVIQVIGQNDMVTQEEITIDNIVNATMVATISAGDVVENYVTITARVENTEIPIQKMELYVNEQKVKSYEYEEAPIKKEETYIITNMEFYQAIACYVKVWNTKGREVTSTSITTINTTTIATATDLKNLATQVNSGNHDFGGKTLQIIKDIDMYEGNVTNRTKWIPIGNYEFNPNLKFKGTLQGNNHIIDNLEMRGLGYDGLFGYIENATITGITIKASKGYGVNLGSHSGMIAGYSNQSTIQNCVIEKMTISTNGENIGGIVGDIRNHAIIQNCINKAQINGVGNYIGGIVGWCSGSSIYNSGNQGVIKGSSRQMGGIVGRGENGAVLERLYNKGEISSSADRVGGIAGELYGNTSYIAYSYNTKKVLAAFTIGRNCSTIRTSENLSKLQYWQYRRNQCS